MRSKKFAILKILVLLIVLGWNNFSNGQNYARFLVEPESAIIKINGKKITNGKLISVQPIEYRVEIWAPNFQLKDTLIQFNEGSSVIKIDLELTEEFIEYTKDLKIYRREVFKKRFLPMTGIAGGSLGIYIFGRKKYLNKSKDLFEASSLEYDTYISSFDFREINESKEIIEQQEKEFVKLRDNYYLTTGISVFTAAVGSYFFQKISNKKNPLNKPVYKETPLLTVESFGINTFQGNGFLISLNLNLN